MKCDELKQVENPIEWGLYYDKAEVDAAIAELKKKLMPCLNGDCILTCEVVEKYGKENAELKARIQLDDDEMAGFLQLEEECGGGDLRNYIAELKQKLEDAKATAYAESVDAGMENRRLRRALWLARAIQAKNASIFWEEVWTNEVYGSNDVYDINYCVLTDKLKRTPFKWYEVFKHVERKCKAKAEEYK